MGVRKEKHKQFDIPNLPFYYLTSPLQKKFNTHKLLGKLMLKFPVAYSTTEHLENVFRKLQQQTNQGRIQNFSAVGA
jgi:hypothetical protein